MGFCTEKKSFTCQQCGLARDQEEIKMTASEVERLSEKASSILSSGSILQFSCMLIVSFFVIFPPPPPPPPTPQQKKKKNPKISTQNLY